MYRHNEKQLEFVEFDLPFGGKLASNNRWVHLAKLIPWEEIEEVYREKFSQSGKGPPALPARMALAALIIKERLGVSDDECVEQIRENPYLQYFCGLKAFSSESPFHPTMMVHFRKRFPADVVSEINDAIVAKAREKATKKQEKEKDGDDDETPPSEPPNKGKLLLDATCTPADISFPTDLRLLGTAREKTEKIIDIPLCVNEGETLNP